MSTNIISFTINGVQQTVNTTSIPPDTSLNTYIREYAGLKGTKFMCLEGGCGVCIVTIKFQQPYPMVNTTCAVNSCLYLLYSCHNTEITTIEGLGNKQIGYSDEQKALANFHGTQCGFCSPGMIMNMHSLMSKHNLTKLEIENSFGGNICRCTGYRPILDAFKSLVSTVDDSCNRDIEDLPKKCPKTGKSCAGNCHLTKIKILSAGNIEWHKVFTIYDIFQIFNSIGDRPYILVCGNTAHGVYRTDPDIEVYIDVTSVSELHSSAIAANITVGANISLNEFIEVLKTAANTNSDFEYCREMATHVDKVANVSVRNTGTIAGNLSIKYKHNEFPSDIFLILETVGAKLTIAKPDLTTTIVSPSSYLQLDMTKCLITLITLKALPVETNLLKTYKIMPRAQNAHAFVNAGFLYNFNSTRTSIISATICYGGINPTFIHATGTEAYLVGKNLFTNLVLQGALNSLNTEIIPDFVPPDRTAEFRKKLALALFYKSVLALCPTGQLTSKYKSGASLLERPISSGQQAFDTYPAKYPVSQVVNKLEAEIQCSGEARYVNDMPKQPFELWAAFVLADKVFSIITGFDTSEALQMPGVNTFLSAKDIPGANTFAVPLISPFIVTNEKLFCDGLVQFNGQPAGIILAESFDIAHKAASKVKILYLLNETTHKPSYKTMEDVLANNVTERIVRLPDMVRKDPIQHELNMELTEEEITEESKEIGADLLNFISDRMILGSQYHFTMETQSCVCIPTNGGLEVYPASQWIDFAQNAISVSCLIPLSKIVMKVERVGGAYGAKLSRASQIACACALGAKLTNRPVRFQMQLEQNMRAIGKRSACTGDYTVSFDSFGRIKTLANTFYEDSGCSINEPNQITALDGFKNCYNSTFWVITPNAVLTDAPSTTWIRSPGTLEGIVMIENIMEHIANKTGKSQYSVRLKNMSTSHPVYKMLSDCVISTDFDKRKTAIDNYNLVNRWRKRGIAIVPLNYTLTFLGIFPVKVQVYADSTVAVTHAGIEMGQGINTKAAQCAAYILGIPLSLVTIKPTSNETLPNGTASGFSITSESVCLAVIKSCEIINARIQPTRNSMTNPTWAQLITACSNAGIDLSAGYTYTSLDNLLKNYAVYAVACAEVEIDLLTGNLMLTRVDITEDVGNSISPSVDVGQIEGAFVMGLGYMLSEELITDRVTGRLLTDRTWNYKPPGAKDIPIDFRVTFLRNSTNSVGVMGSKATGEPPICIACSAIFALRHALTSARKDAGLNNDWFRMSVPSTTESLFLGSGINYSQFKI